MGEDGEDYSGQKSCKGQCVKYFFYTLFLLSNGGLDVVSEAWHLEQTGMLLRNPRRHLGFLSRHLVPFRS